MNKIRLMFYLAMIEFVSDWYSIHKVSGKSAGDMNTIFRTINRLKGMLRTKLEEEDLDESL